MEVNFQLMFDEIKENRQRLDNCKLHHFPTLPKPLEITSKFDCSNCGGRIGHQEASAYTRGYAAAGGDPNEIIPGWST